MIDSDRNMSAAIPSEALIIAISSGTVLSAIGPTSISTSHIIPWTRGHGPSLTSSYNARTSSDTGSSSDFSTPNTLHGAPGLLVNDNHIKAPVDNRPVPEGAAILRTK